MGVWHEGAFAFCTGSGEQKQGNLDVGSRVAVTTGSKGADGWNVGKDRCRRAGQGRLGRCPLITALLGG